MSELQEQHEALADELTGLIRDVVMLHRPDEHEDCAGCARGNAGDGVPVWPCATIDLIKEGMGL